MLSRPISHAGVRQLLLIVVYLLAAASSFSGYFTKWHLRDGMGYASLPKMLDGTADRPYVYRQLMPLLANGVERALPDGVRQRVNTLLLDDDLSHHPIARFYAGTPDSRDPRYALRYYLVYAMAFGALLLALFALRGVCRDLGADPVAAALAPLAFALILPLLMCEGGYFYDLSELLFMALAVRCALRGRFVALAILTALATFNKESFLFFVLMLYPFLRASLPVRATLGVQGLLVGVAAVVNLLVKAHYADNPGGVVQFHLWENLAYLATPSSYWRVEYNYGIPVAGGFNALNLLLLFVLVRTAWPRLPGMMRQSLLIGVAVNVPLFLAFCYHDELRNFSLLYVGFVMILCATIAASIEAAYQAHAEKTRDARNASGAERGGRRFVLASTRGDGVVNAAQRERVRNAKRRSESAAASSS